MYLNFIELLYLFLTSLKATRAGQPGTDPIASTQQLLLYTFPSATSSWILQFCTSCEHILLSSSLFLISSMDQRTQGGPTTPPPLTASALPVECEKEGGGGKKDDEDEKKKREKERDAAPAVPCNSESAGDPQQQQSPQFSVKETSYSEGNVKLKIGLQAKRMKKPPKILENYVCRPAFRATVRHGSRGGGRGSRRVGPSDGSGNVPSLQKDAEKDSTGNPGAPQSLGVPSNNAPTPALPISTSTSPETPVNGNAPAKRVSWFTVEF